MGKSFCKRFVHCDHKHPFISFSPLLKKMKTLTLAILPCGWQYVCCFYQLYTLCLGQLAVAVDTDCTEAEIYWTDAAAGIIRKARLNGSDSQVVMTGSLLVSLCVCLLCWFNFFLNIVINLVCVCTSGCLLKMITFKEMARGRTGVVFT